MAALEQQWLAWRRTSLNTLFRVLVNYSYSEGVHPEALEKEDTL